MTTAINIRFVGESNMGLVHKDIAKMRAEFQLLQKEAMKTAATSGAGIRGYEATQNRLGELRHAFAVNTAAAGQYQILQQKLVPQSVSFAEAIKQQKVGLMDAVRHHGLMNKVLREQIALQSSASLAWSKDATGRISSDLIVPKHVPKELLTARQHLGLYNKLLGSVSQNTINWGKNTQWAGRQLMTGLTLPVALFAGLTAKLAFDMNKQLTQVTKVYGDVTTGIVENDETIRKNAMNTVQATAAVYGQSAKNTLGIMAALAASGKTGIELQQATMAASKASVLGELEYQAAAQATITLQSVYHHNAQQIGDDFNYINAMENQTVLTSKDFTTAIPKISGVMNALGGDLKDVGTLLTAFKGAGIEAAEGANALKTINFRLVATYGKGLKTFQRETGQDLAAIVKETDGKTIPTLLKFADAIKDLSAPKKVQVVRDVFGIYQGSKALLLLEQLTSQSDQLSQAMAVGRNSVAENSAIATSELQKLSDQPFMKIQKAVARMNIELSNVGKTVLPVVASIIDKVAGLVGSFAGISSFKKWSVIAVVGLIAMAGPIIMLVGLFANLAGNIGKVVSSLSGLALRFKFTDAADRSRELHAKAALQTYDMGTAAIERQSIALEVLIKEMQAASAYSERVRRLSSPAALAALAPLPTASPMPTDPTAGGRFSRDTKGRLRIAAGMPGAGNFANEQKALALEIAQTKEMDKQILKDAQLAKNAARKVAFAEVRLADEKKATLVATERLKIDAADAAIKEKQARLMGVGLGGGAFGVGMITSMVAGSDTLIGKLGNVAMMLGMVQMMSPVAFSKILGGLKGVGLAMDGLVGGRIGRAAVAAKTGLASVLPAIGKIAPALAIAGTAVFIFWKIAHDQSEKARVQMENYGKTTQTVADILGFAYQEMAVQQSGGPIDPEKQAIASSDLFIKANHDAAVEMQKNMTHDGSVSGAMWGEAIIQGAKVRLHGGSAQMAEDTAFMVLKVMGAKISETEFRATIKARINFENVDEAIATQIEAIKRGMKSASSNREGGLGGIAQSPGELSGAGADRAKQVAKDMYTAYAATSRELQPKFMKTATDTMYVPFATVFNKLPAQMHEAGINSAAELSKALSLVGPTPEAKAAFFENLGISSKDAQMLLNNAEAIKVTSQEFARLQKLVEEGEEHKIVRPEDVITLQKESDALLANGKRRLTQGEALKRYNDTINAGSYATDLFHRNTGKSALSVDRLSDSTKLNILNMQRLEQGLPRTNNLLDLFGDVTVSAAEAQELLSQKLETNAGLMEKYQFNSSMTEERALSAMATVRTATIEDLSSQISQAIDDEGAATVEAITASGKVAADALDARIAAQEKLMDRASDKLDERLDREKKRQDQSQDDERNRVKKRQEAEKKALIEAFDLRIKTVQDAIKAEEKAEDIRQKIFEAEQTRIQRLADMFNKNVDLNMAINSGNLDEAAKIQNDMISTQQGWSVGDAAEASKSASEKKTDKLSIELDGINKIKDTRLEALDTVQRAEEEALKKRQTRETEALAASHERAKKDLQNTQEIAKAKYNAEKKAMDASNADKVQSVQKQVALDKKKFETELANIRAFVPRNHAEQVKQIADIQRLYEAYGKGTLVPQGKKWADIVGVAIKTATIREGNKIKSEVPWADIGKSVAEGMMKGAFGMTAAQFTTWLNGGTAPPGSPFGPPKGERRATQNSKTGARTGSGTTSYHEGGIIGHGGLGRTTGYSRQAELSPSEKMVRTLTGEGVLSRKAMGRIGKAGFHALNNGAGIGGSDLMSGVGIAGVPMAMIAGAATNVIRNAFAAVARKRQEQDLGLEGFAGLGSGAGNAQKVYNTLTRSGFTPQAAAGVIGNLMQESGVNPGSHQLGGGPGRGIMQWTVNERWASLLKWAGKKDPWALDTQVQFMLKEMNDYGLTDRYKGMKDVNAATDLFEQVMERAGTPNMTARYRHAQNAFKSFGKGQQPGAAIPGGLFGQNINLPGGGTGGNAHTRLINFGRKLQALGFNVGEHPAFGGVAPRPVHSANSWHYKNGAIDVNFDGRGQGFEDAKINSILALAKQYKLRTIWQYLGHYNHAHFDESTGPDMGNFGIGGTGLEKLGARAGMGQNSIEDVMGRGSIGQKVLPVRGKVSSGFGLRDNPIHGGKSFHDGSDIVAPHGTPIHSFAGGRVLFAGTDKALGNYTVVQHANGMLSAYGHQSKQNVAAGQIVKAGQIIGNVGSTGASTGPHLHFQTGSPGKWFDPHMTMPQLRTGGYTMNEGLANLHPKELVVNAQTTKKLHDGIDQFANGPEVHYTIKADFAGANFAADVDVERAFQDLMDKAERRNGSNRKIGK